MYKILILLSGLLISMELNAQTIIPLYTGKVPNSITAPDYKEEKVVNTEGQIRYGKVSQPTLEIYLPEASAANGAAVLIIPGGGYSIVAYTHEGMDIAKEFNKMGIAAFVLKYRLPSDKIMVDKTIGPLQDAQQGIKTIRMRAAEWKIDPAKVGILGFSAGGHLASTEGTHYTKAVIANKEGTNLRPDFMVLVYPVISLSDSLMHKGSRDNLLGNAASAEQIKLYSNELQVTSDTPPTILIQAGDDKTVPVGNSIVFYQSLIAHGVPAEMHLYPKGGHGFGQVPGRTPDKWTERVQHWLKSLDIIK
ncbi:endo-1,4-beta-xylanase B [Arcticibacter svalbardensis MN12-7]|uniref:Endo-1,4-beta-xylanase B n=1 Tax=Arcticibacter svalbardensis MN12-7 TaxID=1150600 RepID=R9GNH1_9SPHI|nr:alpha/beta hydrolase [Arcticibacter svalbardensis]EOR93075.1 endo-1,4-beta-xylanase B [Arcticibacter svalbardensis MN12-7]